MLRIDLKTDGLLPLFGAFSKAELRRVRSRAIKYATRKARTESVRIAATEYALKQKELRSRIFVHPNEGTRDNPAAIIEFQYKTIGLHRFKAKDTRKRGVNVRIRRNGGVTNFRQGFMAKGKGTSKQIVFVRKSAINASNRKYVVKVPKGERQRIGPNRSELPIARLVAKGLSEVMEPHAPKIVNTVGKAAQSELARQVDLILGR